MLPGFNKDLLRQLVCNDWVINIKQPWRCFLGSESHLAPLQCTEVWTPTGCTCNSSSVAKSFWGTWRSNPLAKVQCKGICLLSFFFLPSPFLRSMMALPFCVFLHVHSTNSQSLMLLIFAPASPRCLSNAASIMLRLSGSYWLPSDLCAFVKNCSRVPFNFYSKESSPVCRAVLTIFVLSTFPEPLQIGRSNCFKSGIGLCS